MAMLITSFAGHLLHPTLLFLSTAEQDPDRHGFAYRCARGGFRGVIISGSQYFRLPSRIQTGGIMIQVPVW